MRNKKLINKNMAIEIAKEKLAKIQEKGLYPLSFYPNCPVERPYGWAFAYNTKEFFETGDILKSLLGAMAFVVEKENGRIFYLYSFSALGLEGALAEYEKERLTRLEEENKDKSPS